MFDWEIEVKELTVLWIEDVSANFQFTITGNHAQIASTLNQIGGGHAFAPGATYRNLEYGVSLCELLQPQIKTPFYFASATGVTANTLELRQQNAILAGYVAATNSRIDRLAVQQVTSSVTSAQKKEMK